MCHFTYGTEIEMEECVYAIAFEGGMTIPNWPTLADTIEGLGSSCGVLLAQSSTAVIDIL